jgi:tetratricopeptide (TPR) repeat protein
MKRLSVLVAFFSILAVGCQAGRSFSSSAAELLGQDGWEANEAVMKAAETAGNVEIGLQAGERELAARPENVEARLFLARLQTRAGLVDQAMFTLEPLADDRSVAARLELGRANLAGGRLEEAEAFLQEAMDASPTTDQSRSLRKLSAIAEDLRGRHAEAQKLYAQLLIEHDEPSVRINYGQSLLLSREYSQVVTILTPLLDSPQYVKARFVAAAALAGRKDRAGARDLLESYLPESEIKRILGGES